jgi:IclR family acetate operon transcriptional repressor
MNNTLKNGFMILEYLARTGNSHSVKELAERFALPNSHICRLLKTLLATGYIKQDKSRKYMIDLQILCLSHACLTQLSLRSMAHPHITMLNRELGNDIFLAVPQRGRALIVDVASIDKLDVALDVGAINSLHASASGKICGAYADEQDLEELLRDYEFTRYTDKTIANRTALFQEFDLIREQGYAVLDAEKPGVYAVAAPVFDAAGRLVASIGVSARLSELAGNGKETIIAKALETAEAVSTLLKS